MAITYAPATSRTSAAEYGLEYYSLASFEFEPGIWGEWFKTYGKGFGIHDFLTFAGNTVSIARDEIRAFEDYALEKPIKIGTSEIAVDSTSLTAGDAITFYLDSTEYNAQGNTYLRVGDSIIIPAKYLSEDIPAVYRVSVVGATSAATCTATPLRATAQITTAIPVGTYLAVSATSYGRGMGQPAAKSTYGYYRDFKTHILKESLEITGGMIAQQSYRQKLKNGGEGLWTRAQLEAEFLFNSQKDKVIFLSDENTNSLTGTDSHSANVAIKTTKGWWNHMDALAQELNYVTRFSITDFDTAKDLFRSQGVVDTEIAYLVGPALVTQLDNMGLDYVKEFSGGSNLIDSMGKVGVSVNAFTKNGLNFVCKELVSFSNANTYGVSDLGTYLSNAGAMVPMTEVTVTDSANNFGEGVGSKVKVPNLSLGYLNNDGEDRTNIFKIVGGVNGLNISASHQYDKVEGFYLSEFMVVAMNVNQMIKVVKQGTY